MSEQADFETYDDDDSQFICDECGAEDCDGFCVGAECGRWDQNAPGGMWPVSQCRLAGTEQCDFECPYRG